MSGFTKEIIIRTLFELLNEKPLAKITVKDIVERCGVNRNTFYYHFRDISDVVESALLREVDNAFEHPVEVDSMLECLEVLVKLIGENKKAMPKVFAVPKHREDGTIKSLVERPEGVIHFQSKLNSSPSGWNTPCSTASRSLPFITWATAPIVLK